MSASAQPATPPKRKRGKRWILLAAALVLLVAAALATGVPQDKAVEYGLSRALSAHVQVEGLRLLPSIAVAHLRVASDAEAAAQGRQVLDAEGLTLDYRWSQRRWVRFPRLAIDRLDIQLLEPEAGSANYNFLFQSTLPPEPQEPSRRTSPAVYIPNEIQVREIGVAFETPEGSGRLSGMALDMEFDTLQSITARLSATALQGAFRVAPGVSDTAFQDGSMDVVVKHEGTGLVATLQADLPGGLELKGDAALLYVAGSVAGRVKLETCRAFGALAPLARVPVRFEEVDLSGTTLAGSLMPGGGWNASGNVQAKASALRAGEPEHELYDGDLNVSGAFKDRAGTFELALNRGQRLSVVAEYGSEKSKVVATLIDWSRDGLRDALPKDWRPLLEEVPHLDQVAGTAEVLYEHPGYTITAAIDPVFSPDAARSEHFNLRIAGSGSVNRAERDLFHGSLHAALGSGEADASLDLDAADWFEATAEFRNLDVAQWMTPLESRIPLPLPRGLLSGTAKARRDAALDASAHLDLAAAGDSPRVLLDLNASGLSDTTPLRVDGKAVVGEGESPATLTFDMTLAQPAWTPRGTIQCSAVDVGQVARLFELSVLPEGGAAVVSGVVAVEPSASGVALRVDLNAAPMSLYGLSVPDETPLHAKGTLTYRAETSQLRSDALALTLTDDAHLDLTDVAMRISPLSVSGRVAGKVDFDYVAPILGLTSVVGALTVDAPLRYEQGLVNGTFHLEGDGFGYGQWAGPYGTPVMSDGTLEFDTARMQGTIKQLGVAWGDGTKVSGTPVEFQVTPFAFSGPVSIETNLAPLVDLRFLDSAEGKASVSGTLGYGDGAPRTGLTIDLAANSFVLRGATAALAGLSAAGSIYYEDSLSGNLQLAAANAAAAGAELEKPRGVCAIEDGIARVSGAEASLYGGQIVIDGEVNLLDTGAGGRVEARFTGIDLDRFTKEYEPPSVRLTGLADGTVLLTWNKDGLQDLRVDLSSSQDFSLNREVIESLLLQSLTSGVTGLKMLNRRIQKKTIGEEAMRSFDSATASLSLEGERYEEQRLVGPVALKSETLDFSIEVAVDLRAIADALEIQQQAKLEEGDTISAEPVQWVAPEQEGPSSDE